ncbi:toxin [Schaalia naturae]|jgi:uncharacterized protein YndB with AHSA1/START domain|uniref:Toxin n=1 Tax=Schaalia naturae TaxID=635203 RepID=A0ABW2SMU0_9ACTO
MDIIDDGDDPETRQDYDTIEADVIIHADLEDVWSLVSEPGWWINDGPLGDHETDRGDDGLFRVTDPQAGTWLVAREDEDPMDVVSYRWYPLAGDDFPEERTTRVEFSLSEEDGGIALHVEESGLSGVSDDPEEARQAWEDSAGMWPDELLAARDHLESR